MGRPTGVVTATPKDDHAAASERAGGRASERGIFNAHTKTSIGHINVFAAYLPSGRGREYGSTPPDFYECTVCLTHHFPSPLPQTLPNQRSVLARVTEPTENWTALESRVSIFLLVVAAAAAAAAQDGDADGDGGNRHSASPALAATATAAAESVMVALSCMCAFFATVRTVRTTGHSPHEYLARSACMS